MRMAQASWRSATVVFTVSWLIAGPCLSQEPLTIEVGRDGDFITVAASVDLKADVQIAWEVLSNYDDLARFIPDIRSSRVIKRDAGGPLVVEQKGEFGVLFFRHAVEVTMEVSEERPRRIVARAISGSMKDMETRYDLLPSEKGVKLGYYGRFVPDFFIPPLIGLAIVRRTLERRFRAMAEEIERRDALARNKPQQ
jgi:carbon monoxide dehydrogenase subunit G